MSEHHSPPKVTTIRELEINLRDLGAVEGNVLMVHASLRSLGPIENRGSGLITALLNVVGSSGTKDSKINSLFASS
jgi:aminoglycoside N3'-acetyltransferase